MGTPEFAVPTLKAIIAAGHHVVACYTRPPKPRGRGRSLSPTPVHQAALDLGIPVHTPETLRCPGEIARMAETAPDVIVVAAYGMMLPTALLAIPPMGCLNVHASLLPRWRGAAPIQRAILAGDDEIGVSIMRIDSGMDTGPVLHTSRIDADGLTAGEITQVMADAGAGMMVEVLDAPSAYPETPQPPCGATHAAKIAKPEAFIDFTLPAVQVQRIVRAFNPAPGAWTMLRGERLIIHRCETRGSGGGESYVPGNIMDDDMTIACGDGAIRPLIVQRAGRRPVGVRDLVHVMGGLAGERCG